MHQFVERELSLYVEASEQWKQDHTQAMACYTFEDLLERGVLVYRVIVNADEHWRADVAAGRKPYEKSVDEALREAFQFWLRPYAFIADRLEYFEKSGFEVKHAREFRSCAREVLGILTPDDQFFVDDELVKLRDKAIDDHRSGNCIEYPATERPHE